MFRTSEYLQRNELTRIRLDDVIRSPGNGNAQSKTNYKFTVNDRSSFCDWYNAYFEVQFQVQKLADGTAYGVDRATVINGGHSLIQHMTIKSGGKIVCDTDNLHKVVNLKNLLEYSDDFSRSIAKNSLWYLDTDYRIANANQNSGYEYTPIKNMKKVIFKSLKQRVTNRYFLSETIENTKSDF